MSRSRTRFILLLAALSTLLAGLGLARVRAAEGRTTMYVGPGFIEDIGVPCIWLTNLSGKQGEVSVRLFDEDGSVIAQARPTILDGVSFELCGIEGMGGPGAVRAAVTVPGTSSRGWLPSLGFVTGETPAVALVGRARIIGGTEGFTTCSPLVPLGPDQRFDVAVTNFGRAPTGFTVRAYNAAGEEVQTDRPRDPETASRATLLSSFSGGTDIRVVVTGPPGSEATMAYTAWDGTSTRGSFLGQSCDTRD